MGRRRLNIPGLLSVKGVVNITVTVHTKIPQPRII